VRKKRLFNFLGLVITIAIAIISCQNLLLPKSSPPITVKLSGWIGNPLEQKLLKQVIQDFERQHPQIKVKYEAIADQYMDVIKTRLVGEAAPDVFYLDALEAPFLMGQNVLEPLDNYINPKFDLTDIEPNLLKSFKYQNHIYGLPKDYSTLALFYNQRLNSYPGMIFPSMVNATFIFMMRQFFVNFPRELEEASQLDGLNPWGIFWYIVLPLAQPALAAQAVFVFMGSWNNFLLPVVILFDPEMFTLPLGLNTFKGQYISYWNYIMAASMVFTLPGLGIYAFFNRYFIQSVTFTGGKG
jgi:maltose-binding protein MalE